LHRGIACRGTPAGNLSNRRQTLPPTSLTRRIFLGDCSATSTVAALDWHRDSLSALVPHDVPLPDGPGPTGVARVSPPIGRSCANSRGRERSHRRKGRGDARDSSLQRCRGSGCVGMALQRCLQRSLGTGTLNPLLRPSARRMWTLQAATTERCWTCVPRYTALED